MPNPVALPVHPTTGLTALGIVRGRPVWPVMGGDGNDPDPQDKTGQQGDPTEPVPDPKPADPSAASTAPAKPEEKGFPENTPVADMTDKQEAAYWRHYARRNEDRLKAAPTDAELTELRAAKDERDQLKHAQMTESEKAVEAAKAEGRQAAAAEFGERLVTAEFTAAAAGRPVPVEQLVTGLDKTKFLKDGEPDKDAIKAFVDALAPANAPAGGDPQGQHQRGPDLEQGYKKAPSNTPSVSGGADLYANYKKK